MYPELISAVDRLGQLEGFTYDIWQVLIFACIHVGYPPYTTVSKIDIVLTARVKSTPRITFAEPT